MANQFLIRWKKLKIEYGKFLEYLNLNMGFPRGAISAFRTRTNMDIHGARNGIASWTHILQYMGFPWGAVACD
jgi:hypothetical protein